MRGRKSTPLGTHEMSYNFTIAIGLKLVRFELLSQFLVVIYFSVYLQCRTSSVYKFSKYLQLNNETKMYI